MAGLAFDMLKGEPLLLLQCPLQGSGAEENWLRVRVEWVGLFDPKMRPEAEQRRGAW